MKKALILLLLASLMLSACVGTPSVETQEPSDGEDTLIVVGIIQVGAESDWRIANTESMKSQFTEENGYRLLFEDARQKQENQVLAMRKFIQQQVDYIILLPIGEFGWDSVLQDARDAGIPVIIVDRMVSVDDDSLFSAHVGSDFYRQGLMATDWMEQEFAQREKLNIVHITGTLESTAQIGRTRALEEAVAAHPGWTILAQMDGDFTQPKAYSAMNEYLDVHPAGTPIDVVYCENDNEAFGAIDALEEHGYVCGEDVQVISFDATRGCLQLCMEGKISLAVECNPLLGPLAGELIQMMEDGQTPDKYNYVPEQCFTAHILSEELILSRGY